MIYIVWYLRIWKSLSLYSFWFIDSSGGLLRDSYYWFLSINVVKLVARDFYYWLLSIKKIIIKKLHQLK